MEGRGGDSGRLGERKCKCEAVPCWYGMLLCALLTVVVRC